MRPSLGRRDSKSRESHKGKEKEVCARIVRLKLNPIISAPNCFSACGGFPSDVGRARTSVDPVYGSRESALRCPPPVFSGLSMRMRLFISIVLQALAPSSPTLRPLPPRPAGQGEGDDGQRPVCAAEGEVLRQRVRRCAVSAWSRDLPPQLNPRRGIRPWDAARGCAHLRDRRGMFWASARSLAWLSARSLRTHTFKQPLSYA